jgi:HTH-type transcriptional repressor of NAD biosynthesis genes
MTAKIGITIGKFMPLHKGHELMISFGSAMMDDLVVMVSGKETDVIPLTTRYEWVLDFVSTNKLGNVVVQKHVDKSPTPINIDENGTVLDVDFQLYWANEFHKIEPDATHIVSSDLYGKVVAKRMGLQWLPVDPNREMFNISGTAIREDSNSNFNYISKSAQPYYTKRIAIIGPESSGKTTMSKQLSLELGTSWVTEYGRTLSEAKQNDLSEQDFEDIVFGQQVLMDHMIKNDPWPIMITDTEAYVTYLYSAVYLGTPMESIREFARKQNIDHYILLKPAPWIDDGTRVMSDTSDRERFYEDLKSLLEEDARSFVEYEFGNWDERLNTVSKDIRTFIMETTHACN